MTLFIVSMLGVYGLQMLHSYMKTIKVIAIRKMCQLLNASNLKFRQRDVIVIVFFYDTKTCTYFKFIIFLK